MNLNIANKLLDGISGKELDGTNLLAAIAIGQMNAIEVTLAFANNSLANAIAVRKKIEVEGREHFFASLPDTLRNDLSKTQERLRAAVSLLDQVLRDD